MRNFFKRIAAPRFAALEFAEEDGNANAVIAAIILLAAAVLLILAIVFKDQITDFFTETVGFSIDVETS